VQAQRRHRPPPLALLDQAGVAQARPQPVQAEGLVPLQDVDQQQGHPKETCADQSVVDPQARIEGGRLHRVLVQIEPELLQGPVRVPRPNHQGELTVAGQHLAADPHGLEHQGVLLAALLRTRPEERHEIELRILHGASDPRTGRRA
jgi:hypothetical protein